MSVRPCVCQHGTTRLPLRVIWHLSVFRKFKSMQSDKNSGPFTWRPMHIYRKSPWNLRRMRNVSDKICRGNKNSHILCWTLSPPENRAFVEVMWENMVQLSGHRWCIIWRMRFSCWITKATEYIILFVFWRQQWSRERAWILRLHLPGLSCSNLLTDLMKYQYGGPVGLKLSSHQCRKYGNPER